MYLPDHFREDNAEALAAFVASHPLAMLVTLAEGTPTVDHLPMRLTDGRLRGHVARANPVWRNAATGIDVLAVFGGVHHYVTPSWYPTKQVTGKVVPTWNYSVVHVHGPIRWIDDRAGLHALVSDLTATHEAGRDVPWAVTDAPSDYIEQMLRAIVGFEISIRSIVGKFKASQNRSAEDRQGVAAGLAAEGLAAADVSALVRAPR
jgi:transcriptional regulator